MDPVDPDSTRPSPKVEDPRGRSPLSDLRRPYDKRGSSVRSPEDGTLHPGSLDPVTGPAPAPVVDVTTPDLPLIPSESPR